MPPDCYQVEVIHYLNPHLIWIEVKEPATGKDEHVFEQIGIYGILPQEQTLNIEIENVISKQCEEWLPAANVFMKDFLDENAEFWFTPTHIDRRSSVFDDNIHKYGELIRRKKNGKIKHLSKSLVKSGFAYNNVCDFLMQLSCGKIKTKLNPIKTQQVIQDIENFYIKKGIEKSSWVESIKKQTSVFQMSCNFESSLTVSNLEKHNNQMLSKVLQSKKKDFELCKDVEEESLGRGYRKSKVESVPNAKDLKSNYLRKKLALAKVKAKKSGDFNDTYNDIKNFLDANSSIKDSSTLNEFENKTDNMVCSNTSEKREKENFLRKKLKYHNKFHHLSKIQTPTQIGGEKLPFEYNEKMMALDDFKTDTERPMSIHIKETDNTKQTKRLAFGPPGMNPQLLKIQVLEVNNCVNEETNISIHDNDFKQHCAFGEVDSELGIEITNKNILSVCLKQVNSIEKLNNKYKKMKVECEDIGTRSVEEMDVSDNSFDKNTSSTRSMLLKRKLEAHKKSRKPETSFSSSSTSNKDSSSDILSSKKQSDDDEDDEFEEVRAKMRVKYSDTLIRTDNQVPNVSLDETIVENNVNPFQNIEPNMSVFVDKLVTPILMVHSKHNRRIRPVYEMRDMYFTNHIYAVLKNMSIERPMMLQTVTWFTILRGYSIFMVSPKGSGKTLGYLPAVCRLVSDYNSDESSVGPICIIVCATARSVADVERLAKMFLQSNERVLACYAGVDNLHITTSLLNGCELLICTPSSLVRLLEVTDFGVDLRRLSTFVLDDCERLGSVYGDEIKFFLYKIKDMLKARANNELKVQFILASRIWCDFMEPLAKKVPDTVVCIGAFQECVLYSKANTSVSFVKREFKVRTVFEFLREVGMSKRSVIVCRTDDEVKLLEKAFTESNLPILACDNRMTLSDLHNASIIWSEYDDPTHALALVCCDDNLAHMNITNAHHLLHYSLPPLFSMFCKRFSVLNDKYPSIFKSENEAVKIKILLEENNMEQLPKILNFIRRCTDNIPDFLNDVCSTILKQKDTNKAKKFVPICDNLLALGYCPDIYNCQERHTILKDHDDPKAWLPKEGVITFKILHYHTAALYSARLLSCTTNGSTINYPQTYSSLSLKMGMYYSKELNRKLHGIPEPGDFCAVSMRQNFFARAQIIKIISRYERGNPNYVLVKLIDEEKYEITRDIYLYHLPEQFRDVDTRVVQVRLVNIEPKDKDITFSDLARDHLKKLTDSDSELFLKGNVSLALGNCVFVNSLEVCQELTSLNEIVVKYDLKKELLGNHAIPNPEHLRKVENLCNELSLHVIDKPLGLSSTVTKVPESIISVDNVPKGTWAHLDGDTLTSVFLASVLTPDKFFVRLDKFESCMTSLMQDIQKYVEENSSTVVKKYTFIEGQIVLAKFPDDCTYERARIDSIAEEKVNCFFVDQGDWRETRLHELLPITEQFINQLPFQAIECRLVGIEPPGNEWTEFSTNWFYDQCFEDENGQLKHLFVKCFTKEPAEFTSGEKYGVIIIDTTTSEDVIVNQLMIDFNLARENENEIKYLDSFNLAMKPEFNKQPSDVEDDDWEKVSIASTTQESCNNKEPSSDQQVSKLFQTPLRSVPLVGSENEDEDLDKWDIFIDDDMAALFPGLQSLKNLKGNNRKQNDDAQMPESSLKQDQGVKSPVEIKELDSNDLRSPDNTRISKTLPKNPVMMEVDMKRRPKLVWRQNKNNVIIKIQLIGADNYKLEVEERVIQFCANVNDTDYEFGLELYGVIDKEKSTHINKGQYIQVNLTKVLNKNWLTLTRDGGIKKWIVYDVDNLDTSSDEEAIDDDSAKHIVKNIYNNVDTESDDEDMPDDVNYTYRK